MIYDPKFPRVSPWLWAILPGWIFWLPASPATAQIWSPDQGSSFQIQFKNALDTSVDADVFDVDLFDTPEQTVADLEARVTLMTCYISAGTWENWRPDASSYPAQVLGNNVGGWPGERWVDIRRIDLLGPILRARMDLCRDKGFDAVDADNVDGYQNNTGFALTKADQIAFNRWLAQEAHSRNLSIALKNVPDLVPDLVNDFDWAIDESCYIYGWCSALSPFLNAGKAVFDIEYSDTTINFASKCSSAPAGMTLLFKHRGLDANRMTCP